MPHVITISTRFYEQPSPREVNDEVASPEEVGADDRHGVSFDIKHREDREFAYQEFLVAPFRAVDLQLPDTYHREDLRAAGNTINVRRPFWSLDHDIEFPGTTSIHDVNACAEIEHGRNPLGSDVHIECEQRQRVAGRGRTVL